MFAVAVRFESRLEFDHTELFPGAEYMTGGSNNALGIRAGLLFIIPSADGISHRTSYSTGIRTGTDDLMMGPDLLSDATWRFRFLD